MRARILLLAALVVLAAPAAPAPASDAALRATVTTYLGRLLAVVNAINPADRPSVVRAGTRMIRISTSARRALARRSTSSARGRRGKTKALRGFAQFAAAGRDLRASGRAAPARAERLIGLAAGHMARGQALLGAANELLGARTAGRIAAVKVRPDTGQWYGPTDPDGAFGFKVIRRTRHLYNVRRFHLVSLAPCTSGQTLGFNLVKDAPVGVNTDLVHPSFFIHWHQLGEAAGVQGDVRIEVTAWGRFLSHMRSSGRFEAVLRTRDTRWGTCEIKDGTWHATAR